MTNDAASRKRCSWVNVDDPLLVGYHDHEWGTPVHSDARHFEALVLSGAQAGLNWSLVLKKREGYRRAFDSFIRKKWRATPKSEPGGSWPIRKSSATA